MRFLALLTLLSLSPLFAQTADEKDAIATVQRTFDGMAAQDGAKIRSTMLPDARLYSVRDEAAPAAGISVDDFVNRITARKTEIIERFTAPPKVSIDGRVAQVWGEYEVLLGGKFSHCGIDTVSLFKTADGWKIATLVYTARTTGCKGH